MESRIKYNNIRYSGNQVSERPVLSCAFNLGIINHLLPLGRRVEAWIQGYPPKDLK